LFQRRDQGFGVTGNTAALTLDQAVGLVPRTIGLPLKFRNRVRHVLAIDLVPDLGTEIGSSQWFRGIATCTILCGSALYLSPDLQAMSGRVPASLAGAAWEDSRAQGILPLAWGSDSGRRMAANAHLVRPLDNAPERPTLQLLATLGQGDGFARALERTGVSSNDARQVSSMIASVARVSDIPTGTTIPIVLGPRTARNAPRPLQSLDLRANFGLKLEFRRTGNELRMRQIPIAIDQTPLRIQGFVGEGLYHSARAAGAPPKAIEAYLRMIASKASLNDITPDARFDIIVQHDRAETGETRSGKLMFGGLVSNGRSIQLLEWAIGGQTDWYEASGVGRTRPGMASPVSNARITSGFGMRSHPILGYSRFHKGMDFGAVQGTPVFAVTDGLVAFAGRNAGYGNHIRLNHSATLGSSYSHLSRIAVSPGSRVSQGQLIGYVGSTGLSTGPHLHFEVYRNGVAVNPRTVSFATTSLLSGAALVAFRSKLAAMQAIPIAGSSK
jgi:Peptidase family M23